MSRLTDVSNKLGQYMLQGWVLTDERCPTAGCIAPLLRSPNARNPIVTFCVNCEGGMNDNQGAGPTKPTPIKTIGRPSTPSEDATGSQAQSFRSGTSTPPTEVSSTLSSPIFAMPADTEESLRRRQQSDAASAELGKRLLKGWAMLADECPNPRCFGVPLARPPKSSNDGPVRKECVACGNVYLEDADSRSWNPVASTSAIRPTISFPTASNHSSPTSLKGKEKVRQKPLNPSQPLDVVSPAVEVRILSSAAASQGGAYAHVNQSLDRALHSLADRLNAITRDPVLIDSVALAEVADAITKVAQAIQTVRRL